MKCLTNSFTKFTFDYIKGDYKNSLKPPFVDTKEDYKYKNCLKKSTFDDIKKNISNSLKCFKIVQNTHVGGYWSSSLKTLKIPSKMLLILLKEKVKLEGLKGGLTLKKKIHIKNS